MTGKKGRVNVLTEKPSPPSYKRKLDSLRRKLNRRDYVHPDPLEFLYRYESVRDREIAGLIASSVAYGQVSQILKSVELILDPMGESPRAFLNKTSPARLRKQFRDFRHRFASGDDITSLLSGIRQVIKEDGSLENCFISEFDKSDENVLPALAHFVERIQGCSERSCGHLLPSPLLGSACKRLNLFLRWMVRADDVDPGGWYNVSASKLVIPLDTHMFRVGREYGFTRRKTADMRTALEITEAFRIIDPDDPVKYDFALTREGIWRGGKPDV